MSYLHVLVSTKISKNYYWKINYNSIALLDKNFRNIKCSTILYHVLSGDGIFE